MTWPACARCLSSRSNLTGPTGMSLMQLSTSCMPGTSLPDFGCTHTFRPVLLHRDTVQNTLAWTYSRSRVFLSISMSVDSRRLVSAVQTPCVGRARLRPPAAASCSLRPSVRRWGLPLGVGGQSHRGPYQRRGGCWYQLVVVGGWKNIN